jgi:hypothetical protein
VPAFSMPPNSISYAAAGAKRTAKIKPAAHRESSQFWPRKFCFGNNKNRPVALRASGLMKRDILLVANGDADSNAIIAESALEFGLRLSRRFQAPSKSFHSTWQALLLRESHRSQRSGIDSTRHWQAMISLVVFDRLLSGRP